MEEVDVADEDMSNLLDNAFDSFAKTKPKRPKVNTSINDAHDSDGNDVFRNFENELSNCLKNMSDSLSSLTDPTLFSDERDNADNPFAGMDSMLEGLLQQFLAKELVYPPLKVVVDKYPKWLQENEHQLSSKLLEQRRTQRDKLAEVCAIYESFESDYKVTEEQLQRIMGLIEQAMADGPPPAELVDDDDGDDSMHDLMKNLGMMDSKIDPDKCNVM